jgi:hypothetical protein
MAVSDAVRVAIGPFFSEPESGEVRELFEPYELLLAA